MDDPYELLPEDAEYLNAHHPGAWRKGDGRSRKFGLVVQPFPIPAGYVERGIHLDAARASGYPGVPIDMFYLYPPIQRRDGNAIAALAEESHFGTTWQRWSRHYEWHPGEDTVATHIEYAKNELHAGAGR